jgi:predicted metal-dependent peptidase
MTEVNTPQLRAEGKIRLGIARVAGGYAFHAAVLERLRVQARPEVGTMGVTVSVDLVVLYYNAGFVLDIALRELVAVLLHEVHHVVFGHVLADPADFPDGWARIVAEEVTVNEFVALPLPGNPITLDRFPNLPPMESTRRRYERLAKVRERRPVAGRGTAQGVPDAGASQVGTGVALDDGQGPIEPGSAGRTVDDHGVWAEARRDPGRSRQAICEVVKEALLEAGPDRVPEQLRPVLEGLGIGRMPGAGRYELQGRGRNHLDWRRQLRQYTGQALEERPVFNRPPRRFPDLVGILPGRRRRPARPRVMAVIDTSGSMTGELLEQVDSELARLARQSTVLVVECDAAIHRVYPYRKPESFQGRGGTDFRPALEPAFRRRHRPDLIIFFTDGLGPAPRTAPRTPVIWCLTPGGRRPATWGRVIRMDRPDGS